MSLSISSPDFAENSLIPKQFTCEGANTAPTINWQEIPGKTKSLALIMDDPDASNGDWVHWVIFNIPPNVTKLSAKQIPTDAVNATNSWGETGYGGPCPPAGSKHRYFFKLYALDTTLELGSNATKQSLVAAMQDHILATAQLLGLYQKTGK